MSVGEASGLLPTERATISEAQPSPAPTYQPLAQGQVRPHHLGVRVTCGARAAAPRGADRQPPPEDQQVGQVPAWHARGMGGGCISDGRSLGRGWILGCGVASTLPLASASAKNLCVRCCCCARPRLALHLFPTLHLIAREHAAPLKAVYRRLMNRLTQCVPFIICTCSRSAVGKFAL